MASPEILEVQCAGCGETLEVERGLTEFACPGCATPQALPPELMPPAPPRPRRALPLHHGRGGGAGAGRPGPPMPCAGCGSVLAVPWGLRRLACPVCATDLAVDGDSLRAIHHAATTGGVQVISRAAVAPMSLRRPEVQEEHISQAIRVEQLQAGRYNKPIHFEQTLGPLPARLVHREESTNSPTSNTITGVYMGHAKYANQLFHGEESHINSLNRTVPRLSATPRSICAERVRVEHPSKVSNVPLRFQGGPSNYSVHTEEVHGQCQSNTIGSHGNQRARNASPSSTVDQETVKSSSQTASAEQVQVELHGNTISWHEKRKRSSRTTGANCKKKSNRELRLKCNKQSTTQTEGTRNNNTIQEPVPSPEQNQIDPADIDRITVNLYPGPVSQKQAPQVGSDELDNADVSLTPVSIGHGISRVDRVLQYPAEATCTVPNRSFNSAQEQQMPQETSGRIHPRDKGGQQVWQNPSSTVTHQQQIQDDSHPEHVPLLAAIPLPSNTLPTVLTVLSTHRPQPHCQPPETIHSKDAHAAGMGYKMRRPRGPAKLVEPRREADRPVLTLYNVDTWDINPPCPKVSSTITALLKRWHPGSTCIPVSQRTNEVHQGQLVIHFHQYHADKRAIIMDEFLQRYKWAPGQEAECLKLFDRKTVRQFSVILCDEKRRARLELAASKRVKGSLDAPESNRQTNLDEEGARVMVKRPPRDPSSVGSDDDDPLQWKPFPPDWMLPKWWDMLCEHWASEEILQVSAQKRKNRNTGGSAQHTAGSRSIAMHRKLMMMENGGKPVSEIELFNKTHRHDGGKGDFVTEKARRTLENFQRCLEEAGDTDQLDPHLLWVEVAGGHKRGRYYGLPGVIDKARIRTLSKSLGRKRQGQMFTQDQVQEMINHATQQLNETWENRFQSLEQSMRGLGSSDVPQSTSVSADEATYQSAEDESGEHIGD